MNKLFRCGLATASLIAITGCGVAAQPSETTPVGNNRPATSAPAEVNSPASSPATQPSQDAGTQPFGATYTYEDGLAVTVGVPQPYEPSEYAAGTDGFTQFIVMEVTVVNQTGAAWDPGIFYATLQSGNREGSQIFDSPTLEGPPSTSLLNGREATFRLGFGVADPTDLVLEVSPDFSRDPVIYQLES